MTASHRTKIDGSKISISKPGRKLHQQSLAARLPYLKLSPFTG